MRAQVRLGAMTVGDVLDRGMKILLHRFPTIYLVNFLCLFPVLGLTILMPYLRVDMLLGTAIVALVVAIITSAFCTAVTLKVVDGEFRARPIGPGEALSGGLSRSIPLVGTMLLMGLAIAGVLAVVLIPTLIAGQAMGPAGVLLIVIGFIAALIVTFMMVVWFYFYAQVVVVEQMAGAAALSRSKELGTGYRGRILGVIILFGLIQGIAGQVEAAANLAFPGTITEMPEGREFRMPRIIIIDEGYRILNASLGFLVNVAVSSYVGVCGTMLYFDLRIRKEGYDLELAAEHSLDNSKEGEPPAERESPSEPWYDRGPRAAGDETLDKPPW